MKISILSISSSISCSSLATCFLNFWSALHHLSTCQYVTLHIKIGWRKVNNRCRFGSWDWFFSRICAPQEFAEAGKRRITVVHLLEKSAINMILCAPQEFAEVGKRRTTVVHLLEKSVINMILCAPEKLWDSCFEENKKLNRFYISS